jgi:hypothetical protein
MIRLVFTVELSEVFCYQEKNQWPNYKATIRVCILRFNAETDYIDESNFGRLFVPTVARVR